MRLWIIGETGDEEPWLRLLIEDEPRLHGELDDAHPAIVSPGEDIRHSFGTRETRPADTSSSTAALIVSTSSKASSYGLNGCPCRRITNA